MEPRLLDHSRHGNLAPLVVHLDFDPLRRSIGDSAVQRVTQSPVGVEIRRAVALQSAAHQQFVEAVQPTQAARFHQRHKLGMHGTADRRPPADLFAVHPNLPKPHAARGQHIKRQASVVDADHVHSVTQASAEGRFANFDLRQLAAQVLSRQREAFQIDSLRDIRQRPFFHGHGWSPHTLCFYPWAIQ